MSSTGARIQLIVEGPGDFGAVPALLRKYLSERQDYRPNLIGTPIAVNGISNLTKPGGIEAYIRIAAARPQTELVLVVVDSDKECIKERAEFLLSRCACQVPVLLAIAEHNFEDWIYASIETTIPNSGNHESGRNGLVEIKHRARYTKSVDQAKLAARIDLDLARSRSQSFKRLFDRFEPLRAALTDTV